MCIKSMNHNMLCRVLGIKTAAYSVTTCVMRLDGYHGSKLDYKMVCTRYKSISYFLLSLNCLACSFEQKILLCFGRKGWSTSDFPQVAHMKHSSVPCQKWLSWERRGWSKVMLLPHV